MDAALKAIRGDRSRGLRVFLWSVFALLLIAGGDLVLRACGTWPILGFSRNYCPAPPNRAFSREAETGESLRRQVHAAEMALAEAPPCPAGPGPQTTSPTPVPAPPPTIDPEPSPTSKALDDTIRERGGQRGQLQFSLAWETLDDLDLNVTCPGGTIGSGNGKAGPGICGNGVKDVDANRNLMDNVSSTPVENVVWPSNYPDGVYKIEVIEYRASKPDTEGNRVPFTLRMRLGDEERECHGEVVNLSNDERTVQNGVLVTGLAQTITWKSDQPLPECEFTAVNTVRAPGAK